MKHLFSILCLLFIFPFISQARGNERVEREVTFARVYGDSEKVIAGDSCILSFVIYSSSPFKLLEVPSKMKVRNGKVRALPMRRQGLRRVIENDQIYYALLVEEYVLYTKVVGKVVIPERDYTLELSVSEMEDPFDVFFGRQRTVRKVKLKGVSERFVMDVVEKPMRTTRQMMKGGLQVI